ncbi:exocyst complex component EXO70E2-like [Zingiber officinale]|uniref:Exocyst subunit Exo70 family protein n=1 Tax=Zingiber officinale TaxID=94328 RepID=A0A8J5LPU2_ZINOF|nr:exocyst complex component EXO70E2-like [Zingiber officinale]KAG6520770.1 hypothetical protein ZIOFF_017830 [Zingiber officinale]
MAGCVYLGASQVEGRHVVQEETENLFSGVVEMLAVDLGVRFSNLTTAEEVSLCDIEEQLKGLHNKILNWESEKSLISDLVRDVDVIRELSEVLGLLQSSSENEKHNELLTFAQNILQMGMVRLEDEFVELLDQCYQPLEPGNISFHSAEDDSMDFSSSSFGEESVDGAPCRDAVREADKVRIAPIQHGLISNIVSIANLMFRSNYDKECCQAYVISRKCALEECLSVLQIERLNIEDVLKMEWEVLSSMIKKLIPALCSFIWVCVARERQLCDLVFEQHPSSVGESCFLDITKSSVLQLLSIVMAIAISPTTPEMLFQTLNTYEALKDLLVDMEQFFPEDKGSNVLTECSEVSARLEESVRRTLEEFKYKIRSNISSTAFARGDIHHLTKYVMNYIKALSAYSETLNLILEGPHENDHSLSGDGEQTSSPLAWHLKIVTAILEENIDCKSRLYQDDSLKNIFIMNNVCYMVDKVKGSELRSFLGDEWIRAHIGKFRMHAWNYERNAWSSVISFLREEGICKHNSSTPILSVLKDRFKGFNLAFEEAYKAQTSWIIPNKKLCEDLKISLSAQLIQPYRMFEGRYATHLDNDRHRERYLKYTSNDLEEFLLDLFEGSPKSLQSRRK